MTFNDIVLRNIKKGFRKYLAYYLSGAFCITLFFVFSSLLFNKDINSNAAGSNMPITALFVVSIIAISLFSVVFVLYAHFAFIKSRHRELGVYMTSGMTNKDLNKMLFLELLIIFTLSLITGLITGSVFSRLIQLVVGNLLEVENIRTNTSYLTYLVATASFILIYGVIFLISYVKIKRMTINDLLHEARKKEMKKVKVIDYILAFIGLSCTIFSITFMRSFVEKTAINTNPEYLFPYIITTILGLILMCSSFIKVLIALIRKSRFYRKNLLAVNQIENKFKQNKRIVLVLSIMATLIIIMVGASFSLTTLTDKFVRDASYDIEYTIYDKNEYDEKGLNDALNLYTVKEIDEYRFIYLYNSNNEEKLIASISDYNLWNEKSDTLADDECFNIITIWEPGDHGTTINSTYELFDGKDKTTYTVVKSEKGFSFSGNVLKNESMIVVSDNIYQTLSSHTTNKGTMYKVNYHMNYQKLGKMVQMLEDALEGNPSFTRYRNYRDLKTGYSTFLFVALTQSIMFFISTGCVLFFKQSNELEENKEEYSKLFKIGIADKEVKKVISVELIIVYFIPLIIGFIFGFSIMYYMLKLFSFGHQEALIEREFLSKSFYAWCGYLVFQTAFYLFTRHKSINQILYSK